MLGLWLLIPLGRAPLLSLGFLTNVALLTPGVTCILPPVLLGRVRTAVSSRIDLVGCPFVWVPSVTSFRVRSLTIVPLFFVSPSRMLSLQALGCGN